MRFGRLIVNNAAVHQHQLPPVPSSLHMEVHNVYLSNLMMNAFGEKNEYTAAQYDRDIRDMGIRYEDEEIVVYMMLTRLYHVIERSSPTHQATGNPRLVMRTAIYLAQIVLSDRPFPPRNLNPRLFAHLKREYLRAIDYRIHVTTEQFERTRNFLQLNKPARRFTSVI